MSWGIVAGSAAIMHAEGLEKARLTQMRQDLAPWLELGQKAYQRTANQRPGLTRKAYECAGCGAPLFGLMNENCQYCRRPAAGSGT